MDRDRAEELINAAADGQISADDETALREFLVQPPQEVTAMKDSFMRLMALPA